MERRIYLVNKEQHQVKVENHGVDSSSFALALPCKTSVYLGLPCRSIFLFLKTKQEQTKRTPTYESRGIRIRANDQVDFYECDATMHRCVAIVDLQMRTHRRHCRDLQRNGRIP